MPHRPPSSVPTSLDRCVLSPGGVSFSVSPVGRASPFWVSMLSMARMGVLPLVCYVVYQLSSGGGLDTPSTILIHIT